MNNIIKIWVITIITVVTALLLPSIITYAEETQYNRDAYVVHIDDEGVEHQAINDMVLNEYNYNIGIRTYTILVYLNDIYSSDYWCAYEVMYNASNSTQNVHYIDDIYRDYEAKAIIKHNLFNADYQQMPCIETDCDYYYEFNKDTGYTYAMLTSLFESIINGDDVPGLKPFKDGYVWDEVIGDWVKDGVKYDLEIVKGIEVTIPDTKIVNDMLLEDYVIKWKPSDEFRKEDYFREVETEIYQIQCGRVKEYPWSDWKEFRFEPQLISYPFAYKEYWKGGGNNGEWQAFKDAYYNGFLSIGILASSYDTWDIDLYTSDFLIRYRYLDNNDVMHYSSNFAFVQCKSDGTYTISIPDTDNIDDVEPDSPTIEVPDYTDEIIISKDDDIEVTNIFSTIKALFNTLKDFPTYFGKIFNMFPSWLITLMSFGIGALIIIGILKAVL